MKRLLLIAAMAAGLLSSAAEDIAKYDKNFRAATLNGQKVIYYNAFKEPFEITGFPWRKPGSSELYRMPPNITTGDVSPGIVNSLAHNTSGGAVRFATDSPLIVVRGIIKKGHDMNHMTRVGSAGFDLAVNSGTPDEQLFSPAQPTISAVNGKAPVMLIARTTDNRTMRQYTLFLPLYSGVKNLEIGIKPGYRIEAPREQKIKDPILFYGSSVTQGGCASRPANNYTTMLCREVDAPQINLGFSGNAKGESAVAKAIAGLKLAAFVMDYDYNAPSAEHLKNTHEKFFRIIREAQPELPIIIVSGPRAKYPESVRRRDIVKATYDNAIAAGDKNVYFVDGLTIFGDVPRKFVTVDGTHPTDLGFYLMYKSILPTLKKALGQN